MRPPWMTVDDEGRTKFPFLAKKTQRDDKNTHLEPVYDKTRAQIMCTCTTLGGGILQMNMHERTVLYI